MAWVAHHLGLPVCVLNDIKPYSDPYLTATFTDNWDRDSDWVVPLRNRIEEVRWQRKHCLMVSVQDFDLRKLKRFGDVILNREETLGRSDRRITVLVLRDPFNLLASRLAKPAPLLDLLEPWEVLDAWEVYAEEFIGATSFLDSKVTVNFNSWFLDREYRQTVALQLGFPFTDAGINIVPKAGGGSSFDLLHYDGRASQMRVLDRWRHYQNDARFRNAFHGRRQLTHLCSQLFNFDSDLKRFLRSVEA